jgi:hypothetical protein
MRATLIAIVLALGFALVAAPPASAEDPVVVDLIIDQPRTTTVGDHVRYTLVVEVDEGTNVALAPSALPAEVALVDAPQEARSPLGNGREEVTISFLLAPFAVGELRLPPLPLRYAMSDGNGGVIEAPGSIIRVSSVLPPDTQPSPRDLKPQAEIGTPPPASPAPYIAGLVAVLVGLIVIALARRRFLKYRASRAARRTPVLLGPEDMARRMLEQAGVQFKAEPDYERYYTTIGNTVRVYLTQRYGFPAFALTTRELEDAMMDLGLDRWQVRVATGLLSQCDAVVYARYRPALERADADLTAAFEIVEMSRPEDRPLQEQQSEAEVPVS